MLTPASVIRHRDYSDRRLHGRHAPSHLFTRDSGEYEWAGSLFVPRVLHQPIFEPVRLASGLERLALVVHPATEQEVQAPFDFADGAWSYGSGITRADAFSCIEGETASKLTNDGILSSGAIADGFGTYNGNQQVAVVTAEYGSFATAAFGMYDATAAGWVHLVSINFLTGAVNTVAGSGDVLSVRRLLLTGPNGGPLWRVVIRGTGVSGRSRAIYYYPTSTGTDAGYSFLHELGWEENHHGSNPLPGPSNTPKVASEITYHNTPQSTIHTIEYLHWVDRMTGTNDVTGRWINVIATAQLTPTIIFYYATGSPGAISMYLHNGTAAVASSISNVEPLYGSENEAIKIHLGDGRVRLLHRRSQGVIGDGGLTSAPSGGAPANWGAAPDYCLGHYGGSALNRGPYAYLRWTILNGADATTNTGTGAKHDLFAEVRRAVDAIPSDGRLPR